METGKLADSSAVVDAHQCLLPPLEGGAPQVEFTLNGAPFHVWMKGPKYRSSTGAEPAEGATIKHTARVYPVSDFQGRVMENAWLVGFEEAANGDYQDAVFLIENVKPVP